MDRDKFLFLLKEKIKSEIILKVKNYKSKIVSFSKFENSIKISLHESFFNAEKEIIEHLLNFIVKKDKNSLKIIKTYATQNFFKEKTNNLVKLNYEGRCYNLKKIYENLNMLYFNGSLNLDITYFEKPKYKKFRSVTFGLYDIKNRLIKINKMLDDEKIPFYFINFVIYHEILHDIYPVKIKNLRRCVHSKEFKILEKKFPYYLQAKQFEQKIIKQGRKDVWA